MGDELLITASPYGTQAAAVAGGRPVSFFIEWSARPSRLGDLHVARPLGRMRGIDACIVDIGEGEEAFLQGARTLDADGGPPIVQVVCDAYEGKRARVTRKPALAGRYAVFCPGGQGLTFSRRLCDPRIKRALGAALDGIEIPGGAPDGALTIRGAAAAHPDAVPAEVAALTARWQGIETEARRDRTPRRLWHAGGLLGRLLRDVAAPDTACIAIDDRAVLERARTLAAQEAPDLLPSLALADPSPPLFERHDCTGRLQAALESEVTLPGGARLTIEETRALCSIDVDTSQAAGAAATETAEAAGREIVLRNLSGLIAIDFAGRRGARRREAQIKALKNALAADRTPHRVLGITAGGVVEVNRQRLGPSLRQALTEPASGAFGGRRLRLEAIAHETAHAARREAVTGARALTLRAAPALLEAFALPGDDALARWLGIPVALVPDPAQPHGRFLLERGSTLAAASYRGRCSTR